MKERTFVPETGETRKAIKCDSCIHEGLCVFAAEYARIAAEIENKLRTPENNPFVAEVGCKKYISNQTMVVK